MLMASASLTWWRRWAGCCHAPCECQLAVCGKPPIDTLVKPPVSNQELLTWQALQVEEDNVAAELAVLQLRTRC